MSSGSPHIKFEHSPVDSLADSFVSSPGTAYPSLFNNNETMDPSEVMTPQSYEDESMFGGSMNGSMAGTPAPEKKPVKKRKSWGQQLPEPKTNLPPRKRAKTEDEKEQRRVERVLRNRRAAQSSRERKRQEVEALEAQKLAVEQVNQDLQRRLADAEAKNALLQRQLEQMSGGMNAFHSSSVVSSPGHSEQLRQTPKPITFSQDLFGSRDADERPISTQSLVEPQPIANTVNPAALSPEIGPVVDSSNATSSDLTQHPAAMLCDLPCQSEDPRPWMDSTSTASISHILAVMLMINMGTTAIWTFLSPLSQILTSLRTGSSLPSTNSIISLIIWLTTTTASLKTTRSMSSSTTTTSLRPRFSLRIRLLRRLLACSPNLARPLMDATMVAMRSASEQQLHDCLSSVDVNRFESRNSPSVEALMTLLWAIHVIEKERKLETPKPDAAMVVRQTYGELDELFRLGESKGVSYVWHGRGLGTDHRPKSLDQWRTAFKHDRP